MVQAADQTTEAAGPFDSAHTMVLKEVRVLGCCMDPVAKPRIEESQGRPLVVMLFHFYLFKNFF